jgi:hypothetical protein
MKTPEDKIKGWDRVLLVNDGRCASQSDLNDENIRLILENYLVSLFKINRYKVVTSAIRTPSLSATQYTLVGAYKNELNILLTRKSKVTKLLTERGDDEVYNDEVKKILESKGYKINNWGKHEAIVNGKAAFIRPGSLKDKGWQVTFRGAKNNSFKSRLAAGDGYLIMPRGPILLIPLTDIRDFIQSIDSEAFVRDTIDIFIQFNDYKIIMFYKRNELDLTRFLLRHYE